MQSKFNTAKKMAEKGITTYMAHGKQSNVLLDIINGKTV